MIHRYRWLLPRFPSLLHHLTPDASCQVDCLCTVLPSPRCMHAAVSSHWQLCGTPLRLRQVAHVTSLTQCFPSALVLLISLCWYDRTLLPPFKDFSRRIFQKQDHLQSFPTSSQRQACLPLAPMALCLMLSLGTILFPCVIVISGLAS